MSGEAVLLITQIFKSDRQRKAVAVLVEVVGKVPYKTGKYHIKSAVGSDMMLDVNKTSTADGTEIVITVKAIRRRRNSGLMYGAEGSTGLLLSAARQWTLKTQAPKKRRRFSSIQPTIRKRRTGLSKMPEMTL